MGVPLGNGTDTYPEGDEVQAVEPWEPPSAFADASMGELVRVLEQLDRGPGDGEQYGYRSNSKRWAGSILATELDKTDEEAKRILLAWKREGLIKTDDYDSPERREAVPGLQVDAGKLAEMKATAYASNGSSFGGDFAS